MLHLKDIEKKIGSRVLFEGVTVSFKEGCRTGLTGPNGAGKSTLLKMIMGIEPVTSGQITLPERVGMLRQDIETYRNDKVIDVVMMGNQRLWKALQERDRLYEGEMTDAVGIRLGELEEVIADEDGYTAEAEAEQLLEGAGVERAFHNQQMSAIPTDLQFRALLCQALFGRPQALLLDEPTNHLDLDSIGWLEQVLKDFKGALVVVSHDRHFLNAITTHIADIDYDTVILYPGNYDEMIVAKSSVRSQAESEARSKEKKIAQLREFVARFGAGTRASQVQSRLREIDRLDPGELKKSNIQRPYIRFPKPEKVSGQRVFNVVNLRKGYDEEVIKNLSFEIHRGDRVGIIGNNGRGKTTLLKMLAGVLQPDSGVVEVGHQVNIAYFPQIHADVIDKSQSVTLLDWLRKRHDGKYEQELRSVLGKMLFGGDEVFKRVPVLSGGETARLLLADMMLGEDNVIILDEPNNHLDLEAVSALGQGLAQYPETVICASHDRAMLDAFATKIIAFEEDRVVVYEGNLEEYLAHRK